MNGQPRDEATVDLAQGRPTLSPEADELARSVMALLTFNERDEFSRRLSSRIGDSPAWQAWVKNSDQYLCDLDPTCVAEITPTSQRRTSDFVNGQPVVAGRFRPTIFDAASDLA